MDNSIFSKIINFVKKHNIDNEEVQLFKYNKNEETIFFLIEEINKMCYEEHLKKISIKIYDILIFLLNKNIDAETIDNYFENLYYDLHELLT